MTTTQNTSLVVLRVLIGWHFLYEGIIKLYNPGWTAKGYLLSAEFFRPLFQWMATDGVISVIDTLNVVGLIAAGISLMAGIRVRWGCIIGMGLLIMYYIAHPPFSSIAQGPVEGSYWIVNKNLIEIAALFVIYIFPTSMAFGLERIFRRSDNTVVQP